MNETARAEIEVHNRCTSTLVTLLRSKAGNMNLYMAPVRAKHRRGSPMRAYSQVMAYPFQKRKANDTAIDINDAESGQVLAVSFHSLNLLLIFDIKSCLLIRKDNQIYGLSAKVMRISRHDGWSFEKLFRNLPECAFMCRRPADNLFEMRRILWKKNDIFLRHLRCWSFMQKACYAPVMRLSMKMKASGK